MHTLYLDPGFSRTGWAVFNGDRTVNIFEGCGLIETLKSGAGLRKSDDAVTRCRMLAVGVAALIQQYECKRLVWEVPTGGARNAAALYAMSLATGTIAACVGLLHLWETRLTPRAVKIAATGQPDASKSDVEAAVLKAWPAAAQYFPKAKARREHIADALACRMADNVVIGADTRRLAA